MQFLKGMATDTVPEVQPPGTYRYLLNGILTEELGAIVSEKGNAHLLNLSTNQIFIIGTLWTIGEEVFVFCILDNKSKILKVNLYEKTVVVLLEDSEDIQLNFNINNSIQSTYTVQVYGEKVIYFTDGVNPPRYLNTNAVHEIQYTYQLNLFPTLAKYPKIKLHSILDTGGSLLTGNYTIGLHYHSEDETKTNSIGFDNWFNIIFDDRNAQVGGYTTTKSAHIKISNIDESFKFLTVVVVYRKMEGSIEVYALPKLQISNLNLNADGEYSLILNGTEEKIKLSLEEVLINYESYNTAKALALQDGNLYLANLTKNEQDFDFQSIVENIKSEAVLVNIPSGQYNQNKVPSFKEGEAYAFYMSFILEDGTETQAYLIQGREAKTGEKTSTANLNNAELGLMELQKAYLDIKDYHVIPMYEPVSKFGFWENEADGVRHHRFPYIKDYTFDPVEEDEDIEVMTEILFDSSFINMNINSGL
jgi:hypothetical protein